MKTKYSSLFTPFKIGNVEFKNRFFMASMGGNDQIDDVHGFGDKAKKYYIERAKGGLACLATGTITIRNHPDRYIVEEQFMSENVDKEIFKITCVDLIKDIHAYGSKILMQISIGTSPCQFPGTFSPSITVNEITKEEIQFYIERYADAAKLAKDAGFDMIEVHSVHTSYLLDQFSTASTNHRTDEYGGSLENRARLCVDIIKAIREKVGPDYPVSLKISARTEMYDMKPDGSMNIYKRDLDETLALCKIFQEAGYSAFNVDGMRNNSVYTPNTTNIEDWKTMKQALNIPIIAAGSLADPDLASYMIENGYCDFIAMGRQTLCDPAYPNKLKANKIDDIRFCMKCNGACITSSLYGFPVTCVANPRAGLDADVYLHQAEEKKKVFVIGGGLGGMEAAITASKRGHDVSLFEKTDELGGLFLAASAFEFKDVDRKMINYYKHQLAKSPAHVYMNTEVDAKFIEANEPDVVIVATGANAFRIPVPGADSANVVMVEDAARKKVEVGKDVVIIGAGLSGCELAAQLVLEDKNVTVVEMMAKPMATKRNPVAMSINPLLARVTDGGGTIMCNTRLKEIKDGKVVVENADGIFELAADNVVMAAGFKKNDSLYKELRDYAGEVYVIGDAEEVDDVFHAIWGGFNLGKGI